MFFIYPNESDVMFDIRFMVPMIVYGISKSDHYD